MSTNPTECPNCQTKLGPVLSMTQMRTKILKKIDFPVTGYQQGVFKQSEMIAIYNYIMKEKEE